MGQGTGRGSGGAHARDRFVEAIHAIADAAGIILDRAAAQASVGASANGERAILGAIAETILQIGRYQ